MKKLELRVVSEELCEALARHPGVKDLDIAGADLTSVTNATLVEIISKLEIAKLCSSLLTKDQVLELFSAIERGLHLKRLVLWDIDLSFAAWLCCHTTGGGGSESNRADSGGNLCKSGARGDQVEVDEDMGVQQHLVLRRH